MTEEDRKRMMDGVHRDNQMAWGGLTEPVNDAVQIGPLPPKPNPEGDTR